MLEFLKKLFGAKPATDYKALMKEGAVILDVRTKGEFSSGHIAGALNLPLDTLGKDCVKIKKEKTIITCCASGMRSASARRLLQSKGYTHVFNGGGWMSLRNKIQ